MKKIIKFTVFFIVLSFSMNAIAEGYCIRLKNNKLSAKSTKANSCPSGQAFVPTIAGETGETGLQGPAGADGSARAYGFVSSGGNINTAKSSTNVSARKVSTGIYCISASGIDPTTVMPVVSADQDDGSGSFHIAQLKSQFGGLFGCTASEWSVHTSNYSSSFSATDIAFSFIIP